MATRGVPETEWPSLPAQRRARRASHREAREAAAPEIGPRGPPAYEGQDMFNHHKVEIDWGGRPLTLETGKIARQADGAVLATYGETVVLATVVSAKAAEAGHRLLPADRQLPGKDLRRRQDPGRLLQARRPSDREGDAGLPPDRPPDPPAVSPTATRTTRRSSSPSSSMTWRTIRTSVAMVAASAALTLSGVPFMGPIGGARVGYIDGEYVLNPACRRDAGVQARPRRRRHRRRRADGRVRSQGTRGRRSCSAPSCSVTAASSR